MKNLGLVNSDSQTPDRTAVAKKVHKLIKVLANYADIDQAADKLGKKFMYDSMPPVLAKKEVRHTSRLDGDFMKNGKILNRSVDFYILIQFFFNNYL